MTLSTRDTNAIWHPFTQHQMAPMPIPLVSGKGAYLFAQDGQRYLDLISSWWVNIHGHAQADIAQAIYDQALQLEHVIFSGFTHEPAVAVAEELLGLLPAAFNKVFYSDNGSTAVEIALKMAYQFWHNQGQSQRKRFIAFDHAYHGDTFGAMAVGKKSGFFPVFEELLFKVDTIPYPATWHADKEVVDKEEQVLTQLAAHLAQYGHETAALIVEPLVQGASGMNMCRPEFLQRVEQLLKTHQVLIIYDEVMTAFGRTGETFACLRAKTTPDIICLAKGLTGGFLPLAVTACREEIYQAFLGNDFNRALAHGHSFTANPLGCAAALASLKLLKKPQTRAQIQLIEAIHQEELGKLAGINGISKSRWCGTIAAFDVALPGGYGSQASLQLRERFLKRGLLIRPLGTTIYLMPPYCISIDDLRWAYEMINKEIQGVCL
jgi:adenosylmethionine-8-amino-7-oxononanoate aminotransferase